MPMQWIYEEYLTVYTQYLGYYTSVLILLISAVAFSFIKATDDKKLNFYILSFFGVSFLTSCVAIYLLFQTYNSLRNVVLLMSSQCSISENLMTCKMNIQDSYNELKPVFMLALTSFLFLIAGYIAKLNNKKALSKMLSMILVLCIIFIVLWCYSPRIFAINDMQDKKNKYLNTPTSAYIIDSVLLNEGYSINTQNETPIILYKGKTIPINQFYPAAMGSPFPSIKAMHLYITIKNSFRNANININENFTKKTDANGSAIIDIFVNIGNYKLSIYKQENSSLNYLFKMSGDKNLNCSGIKDFNCQEE